MIAFLDRPDGSWLTINDERVAWDRQIKGGIRAFIIIKDKEQLFVQRSFRQLPQNINVELSHIESGMNICRPMIVAREQSNFVISLRVRTRFDRWTEPYSIFELVTEIKSIIARKFAEKIDVPYTTEISFELRFRVDDSEAIIGDEVDKSVELLKEISSQAASTCLSRTKPKSLATYFSFPDEVKSACEQYLLYFGTFLRDIGIKVSVEIKEETDRVLFSVTPRDSHEALDRIRQALDLYLELPTANFSPTDDREYRLESQLIEAQIMHFKSQLILARATIEQKDAAIGLLNQTVVLQGQMIEGRFLSEPTQQKKTSENEQILGGAVEIKKYEGKGFNVNLPKLFRDLREYFKRKQT